MQNLQDIQEKIFFESKTILETLSRISSKDELLAKQNLFAEVTDRIAFLRILEKNKESFISDETVENPAQEESGIFAGNEILNPEFSYFDDAPLEEEPIEEEVMFNIELNEIENEEPLVPQGPVEITADFEKETVEEEQLAEIENEYTYEQRVAQKETELEELEERRRKIVEFSKENSDHLPQPPRVHETKNPENQPAEKKIKLAPIKGLKLMQNLFDDDPLERTQEEETHKAAPEADSRETLTPNIPTGFMEAEKKKNEFRLDLNDKVAFTKVLFNGDADELKKTVDTLNSFNSLEDARHYLSDVYYQKNWKKVDEYAQRLWNLVENKFL